MAARSRIEDFGKIVLIIEQIKDEEYLYGSELGEQEFIYAHRTDAQLEHLYWNLCMLARKLERIEKIALGEK
jgi:hypothetical protein